jgi:GPI mannosyltransferase 2
MTESKPSSLTARLSGSRRIARVASLIYLLSPSPGALVSPYTEPIYALLTFTGMLLVEDSCNLLSLGAATACFAASTSVRPTGLLNGGYLIWKVLVQPWTVHGRPSLSAVGILLSLRRP